MGGVRIPCRLDVRGDGDDLGAVQHDLQATIAAHEFFIATLGNENDGPSATARHLGIMVLATEEVHERLFEHAVVHYAPPW